ncbi:DtxR family transcriptional regulator, Mn-dependent transcriptional regulator [Desulfovibrionales bacterium]
MLVGLQDRHKDECLEKIWVLQERGKDDLDSLAELPGKKYNIDNDAALLAELCAEGLTTLSEKGKHIALTKAGSERARHIIRAHRIGERLLFDVFRGNIEAGACEFEHTLTVELIDSLCTLLGHPRKCPHGNPIPEAECCRKFKQTAQRAVVALLDLEVGKSARVAYIDCCDKQRLFQLNGFQVRPGVEIVLEQRYPCIVVCCEGSSIALDEAIATGIRVWMPDRQECNKAATLDTLHKPKGFRRLVQHLDWLQGWGGRGHCCRKSHRKT